MNITKRTWAEISLDNIRKNYLAIKKQVNNTKICCVIKADGYGHGAVELAQEYEKLGADFLAVSNLDEAIELRENNIKLPILILGYTDVNCAEAISKYNVHQAVYSLEYAQALHNQCKEKNVKVNIHIKLDTGMSRIGFMCQQFPRDDNSIKEIYQTCLMENFIVEGIFTHFCVSDEGNEGKDFTQQQYNNFTHTVSQLNSMGINFNYIHCSNSGAVEDYPYTYNTMVRAGIILYGL
ncbi:MAG: alanine racemase, partial [Ruminococcus sp.]